MSYWFGVVTNWNKLNRCKNFERYIYNSGVCVLKGCGYRDSREAPKTGSRAESKSPIRWCIATGFPRLCFGPVLCILGQKAHFHFKSRLVLITMIKIARCFPEFSLCVLIYRLWIFWAGARGAQPPRIILSYLRRTRTGCFMSRADINALFISS